MINQKVEDGTVIAENEHLSPSTSEKTADFETAISGTGFGLFNLILVLITFLSILAGQCETASLSFVFPAAQCDLNLTLLNRGLLNAIPYAEFHSWNLFLLICSLPAFLSGIFFTLMPESPKYLMTKGDNQKALEVFMKVYKWNTGKAKEQYPIKKLSDDQQIHQRTVSIKEGWKQISPLFSLKYAANLVLVCLIQLLLMLCLNSLRLWLPEIFQTVNDYEPNRNETASFCKILNSMQAVGTDTECSMNFDNSSVYINSIIVAVTAIVGHIPAVVLVNKVGKKRMLICLAIISGISFALIYFAPSSSVAFILICINILCSSISIDMIITIAVDIFPTYLRASALSLAFMSNMVGSSAGNLIFPILLQAGCVPLFFTFGGLLISCAILSIFLPKTDCKPLE